MTGCLRIAIGIVLLAHLGLGLLAAYNRLGPERGTLLLDECRLRVDPGGGGLIAAVIGHRAPLALVTVSQYAPAGSGPPAAERLAAFGFSVDPERNAKAVPRRAHVLVEAEGPHVDAVSRGLPPGAPRPVLLVDVAPEAGPLRPQLGDGRGRALARGIVAPLRKGDAVILGLRLAAPHLAIAAADRALLRRLGERPAGPCRPRFVAEIAYGAASDPLVRNLRPLERPLP
ncbi:MAG: hypothetical protein D6807_05550 [Alphaproteobacteria bacterium]|nr:MAG: hypothetical protein D6807_05550 [Alphaproteobacteria bacterium]